MAQTYLLAKTTGTGNQADVSVAPALVGTLQVEMSSTGSITIQGRTDQDMSWQTIAGPYTANALVSILWCPQVRATISANGGTITAKLAAGT